MRVELSKKVQDGIEKDFLLQFIYDDEVLRMPWCHNEENPNFCPLDDFIEYVAANVILDFDYVDKFCKAEAGKDYTKA